MKPLWTQIGGLMPTSPLPDAVPMLWRWSTLLPLAERAGELVPVGRAGSDGRSRWQPRTSGHAYATPTLWARSSTSVRAKRLPRTGTPRPRSASWSRARGLDQRRRRSGRDAAGRPAADPGDALPRAPQHHRPPDGVDRRTGHPAGPHDRRGLLRVRPGRAGHDGDPGGVAQRAALGAPGLTPVGAPRRRRRRSWPTAGSTPTPRSPRSSS
jgi:hypothetical protein